MSGIAARRERGGRYEGSDKNNDARGTEARAYLDGERRPDEQQQRPLIEVLIPGIRRCQFLPLLRQIRHLPLGLQCNLQGIDVFLIDRFGLHRDFQRRGCGIGSHEIWQRFLQGRYLVAQSALSTPLIPQVCGARR